MRCFRSTGGAHPHTRRFLLHDTNHELRRTETMDTPFPLQISCKAPNGGYRLSLSACSMARSTWPLMLRCSVAERTARGAPRECRRNTPAAYLHLSPIRPCSPSSQFGTFPSSCALQTYARILTRAHMLARNTSPSVATLRSWSAWRTTVSRALDPPCLSSSRSSETASQNLNIFTFTHMHIWTSPTHPVRC